MSNAYHDENLVNEAVSYADESLTKDRFDKIMRCVELGMKGALTNAQFNDCYDYAGSYCFREVYVRSVSWSVYTVEYIDRLKRLVKEVSGKDNPSVLEVCAGNGVLGKVMDNWTCTDISPTKSHVIKAKAVAAVKYHGFRS